MTATRHALHPPAPVALWRAGKQARHVLALLMRRCADAWQRRRQARAALGELRDLAQMSAYQLLDLGLDRSELPSIFLCPDDDTRVRFHRHR
jgi:uncharacterized protein YjiS (DUF1127 family)